MIRQFDDTGEAYDACQCDEEIKSGDTLDCGDVIGLASTWPFAITEAHGHFHTISEGKVDWVLSDAKISKEQLAEAVKLAKSRNLKLQAQFCGD